jgi:hypothetical protein
MKIAICLHVSPRPPNFVCPLELFEIYFIYVFSSRYYIFMSIVVVYRYRLVSFEVVILFMLLIFLIHAKVFV